MHEEPLWDLQLGTDGWDRKSGVIEGGGGRTRRRRCGRGRVAPQLS